MLFLSLQWRVSQLHGPVQKLKLSQALAVRNNPTNYKAITTTHFYCESPVDDSKMSLVNANCDSYVATLALCPCQYPAFLPIIFLPLTMAQVCQVWGVGSNLHLQLWAETDTMFTSFIHPDSNNDERLQHKFPSSTSWIWQHTHTIRFKLDTYFNVPRDSGPIIYF